MDVYDFFVRLVVIRLRTNQLSNRFLIIYFVVYRNYYFYDLTIIARSIP